MQVSTLIIIAGPTGAGKSELALRIGEKYQMEIVSADSLQVYRFLDIGTAKPSLWDRRKVPHHLIDIVNPDEEFSAVEYMDRARKVINKLLNQKIPVLIVGGSGLYIKALIKGIFKGPAANEKLREELKNLAKQYGNRYLYQKLKEVDPESALRIHPNDTYRILRALEVYKLTHKSITTFQYTHRFSDIPYNYVKIGIERERKELYQRIEKRVDQMIEAGLIKEVSNILKKGYTPELKPLQSLGYRQIIGYLQGKYTLEEAIHLIKRDTKRYAKRQLTWFKGDPEIEWFHLPEEYWMIEKRIRDILYPK